MPGRPKVGFELICLSAAMLTATLVPSRAGAALGEPETTSVSDATFLKGSVKSTHHSNYHVDEIQLPSGTVLREFAAAGGVFAVAWSGPAIPNLRQALGSYFAAYARGAKVSRAGRRHLSVQQDDFVMQSNGRMRAFSGRAYLPRLLPAGVSLDELH